MAISFLLNADGKTRSLSQMLFTISCAFACFMELMMVKYWPAD